MNQWPETESVLARFRDWLEETRMEAESLGEAPTIDDTSAEKVGLYQLVERLTSLRQEVKLLTKSTRGSEERNEATLLSMQAAIEQFRSIESNESGAAEKAIRPLAEGLADLDEALHRGRLAIENVRRCLLEETSGRLAELREQFEALYRAQPWWRRLLCRPWHTAVKEVFGEHILDTRRNIFDSLLEGYDLIQARLQRTMDEHEIIRMECVGRQADPNCMTVLEAVSDRSRPAGLVVAEVRLGYYWKTKVLRFAEVKAVAER
jgi:molecular chaperone GrpE (heat shock protein)